MAIYWTVMLICEEDVAAKVRELLDSEFTYTDYSGKKHTQLYKNVWYPSIRASKDHTGTEFFWGSVCWDNAELRIELEKILKSFDSQDGEGSGYIYVIYNDYDDIEMKRHIWSTESAMSHSWLSIESDDFQLTECEVV